MVQVNSSSNAVSNGPELVAVESYLFYQLFYDTRLFTLPRAGTTAASNDALADNNARDDTEDSDMGLAYTASVTRFKRSKPSVMLYVPDDEGNVVGRAQAKIAKSMKMALGPGDSEQGDKIEGDDCVHLTAEAANTKGGCFGCCNRAYAFVHRDRKYVVRRTKQIPGRPKRRVHRYLEVVETSASVGAEGTADDMESSDEMEGRLVAAFVPRIHLKQKGTMEFYRKFDDEAHILILLAVLAWRERSQRRRAASGAATAGQAGWMAGSVY